MDIYFSFFLFPVTFNPHLPPQSENFIDFKQPMISYRNLLKTGIVSLEMKMVKSLKAADHSIILFFRFPSSFRFYGEKN